MRGAGRCSVSMMSVTPVACHARAAGASAPLAPSQLDLRPDRHDSGRIDTPVALIIMVLDVEEVDGLGDARQVVKLPQIAAQRWVVPDLAMIALEVSEIDWVEADKGGEEAPVSFRQPLADEEALAGEPGLEPVQSLEQLQERLFIGRLRGGETGAIDPIVDRSIDAVVDLVDLRPEAGRIIVPLSRAHPVEGAIEHADDF